MKVNEKFNCVKNVDCKSCSLNRLSFFNVLDDSESEVINRSKITIKLAKGDKLFTEGEKAEKLFCISKGKVKISKKSSFGLDPIVRLYKEVDLLGLKSIVLDHDYFATATALEDTSVCVIEKKDFLRVLNSSNLLSFKVIELLANQSRTVENQLIMLTKKQMRARIAGTVLLLKEKFGTLKDEKTLNIRLKRDDIAALANMTTSNAIRVLSSFSSENLVTLNKREIKIMDLEGLKTISSLG